MEMIYAVGREPGSEGTRPHCILHIGMHKTGSSSIQESLHSKLSTSEWCYLDLIHANHGVVCGHAFRSGFATPLDRAQGLDDSQIAPRREWNRQLVVAALRGCRAENAILSGEGFSIFTADEAAELASLLKQHVCSVRVVGYVRPPLSFLESRFQEQLKVHAPNWHKVTDAKYRFRFEKYDLLYGRAQVDVRRFEPARFPEGCVVRDFCARLGIRLQADWIVRTNEGLSREASSLLYAYRRFSTPVATSREQYSAERTMIARLQEIGGDKLRFTRSLSADMLVGHEADIAWMEERLGESLQEPDRPDGVNSLDDLLTVQPATVEWLAERLDRRLTTHPSGAQLGEWMASYRHACSSEGRN